MTTTNPSARGAGADWRALIVGYHNVAPSWFTPGDHRARVRGFASQVRWLSRIGHVVPLHRIVNAVREGRPLPPRAIAITFDDGYRDNLTEAVPILERLGLPATFYLVTGLLDQAMDAWWETVPWAVHNATCDAARAGGVDVRASDAASVQRFIVHIKTLDNAQRATCVEELVHGLAPSGTPPGADVFMDWDEARRLAATMDIGSHTGAHAILARETPADQSRDLRESRERLMSELGVPIASLAYPNGRPEDIDAHTLVATGDAGYHAAVTTVERFTAANDDALRLPRLLLDPSKGLREAKDLLRTPEALRFFRSR